MLDILFWLDEILKFLLWWETKVLFHIESSGTPSYIMQSHEYNSIVTVLIKIPFDPTMSFISQSI